MRRAPAVLVPHGQATSCAERIPRSRRQGVFLKTTTTRAGPSRSQRRCQVVAGCRLSVPQARKLNWFLKWFVSPSARRLFRLFRVMRNRLKRPKSLNLFNIFWPARRDLNLGSPLLRTGAQSSRTLLVMARMRGKRLSSVNEIAEFLVTKTNGFPVASALSSGQETDGRSAHRQSFH
jgi:hypothetical protein